MTKYLYLVVGRSGAGKTATVKELCQLHNLTEVISYTTRPRRKNEGNTHVFVNQLEFEMIRSDISGYTFFNGYEYASTNQQLCCSDLYVIDPKGIKYFKTKYRYSDSRPYKIIYIDVDKSDCKARMLMRGDSPKDIEKRSANDDVEFKNKSIVVLS